MKASGRLYNFVVFLIAAVPSYFFSFSLLSGFAPYYAYELWGSLTGLGFFVTRQITGGKVHLALKVRTVYVVAALSMVSIFAALATTELRSPYEFYVLWSSLPNSSYFHFLLAVLAVDFVPGYMLLYLTRTTKKLGVLGTVLFSFILSYFVSILISFYLVKFQGGLGSSYEYVTAVDVALSMAAILYSSLFDRDYSELKVDDSGLSLVFLLLTFGFLYTAVDYAGNIPFLKGDLFTLWGQSMRYLQPGWQTATNLNYPQAFYWNLAVLVNQATIPSMNAAVLTIPLVLLVPMAIAFTAEAVSKDKTIAILASLGFTLFGPFLWTLALDVTNTYAGADPMTSIPFYTWDFKDTTVGVICTVPLIGLLFGDRDMGWAKKALPLVAALASGILAHVIEPIIFVGAFLPVWMLTSFSSFREKVYGALVVMAGLGVTYGIGEGVGMSSAILAGEVLGLFAGGLLAVAVVMWLGPVRRRLVAPAVPALKWLYARPKALFIVLLYLYGLSVFAFTLFPSINMQVAFWDYGTVPLGAWWLVLGVSIPMIALGYLLGVFERSDRWVPAVLGGLLLSVLVIETLGYLNTSNILQLNTSLPTTGVPTGILAWRLLVILLVPVALLFGFAASRLYSALAERNIGRFVLPLMVIGLILLGIPSAVIEARTYIGNQAVIQPTGFKLTTGELNATSFMAQQLPLNTVVLSFTARGSQIVTAGERNVRVLANLSSTALGTVLPGSHDPYLALSLLQQYHVNYIFVDQFDSGTLAGGTGSNGTGYLIAQLIPHLPVVFNQEGNVIYSVPSFNQALVSDGVGLFSPFNETSDFYNQATLLSLSTSYSGLPYGYIPSGMNSIIVPYDPLPSIGPSDYRAFRSETAGDNVTAKSFAVTWSVNATGSAPHTLVIDIGSSHATHVVSSVNLQMFRTGVPLSCQLNSTSGSTPFISDFTPNNGTIYVKVPSSAAASLDGLLLTCTPSGKSGQATVSFENLAFNVPSDLLAQQFAASYPQQSDLSNYVGWAEAGGNLLVVDPGLPLGYFGHFMGLQSGRPENVTSVTLANGTLISMPSSAASVAFGNATALMWYGNATDIQASPLLLQEKLGAGNIYWAQLGPLLGLLERGNLTLAQASAVYSEMLGSVSPHLSDSQAGSFDAIMAGTDTLQGLSTSTGSYAMPYLNGVRFAVFLSSTRELTNFTVSNVFGTGAVWKVTADYATMGTSSVPGMVNMTYSNGGNLTIGPPPGGTVVLSGSLSGTQTNFTLSSPLLLNTTKSFTILFRSPNIILHGTIQTNRVYVSSQFLRMINIPPYGGTIFQSGGPFQAKGNMNITTTSFKDAVMITTISGSWQPADTNPPTLWSITNAGWVALLISQGDVVLLIAVGFLVYARRAHLKKTDLQTASVPESTQTP